MIGQHSSDLTSYCMKPCHDHQDEIISNINLNTAVCTFAGCRLQQVVQYDTLPLQCNNCTDVIGDGIERVQ